MAFVTENGQERKRMRRNHQGVRLVMEKRQLGVVAPGGVQLSLLGAQPLVVSVPGLPPVVIPGATTTTTTAVAATTPATQTTTVQGDPAAAATTQPQAAAAPAAQVTTDSTPAQAAPAAANNNNNNAGTATATTADTRNAQAAAADTNAATAAQDNSQAAATQAQAQAYQVVVLQSQASILQEGGIVTTTDAAGGIFTLSGTAAAASLSSAASSVITASASKTSAHTISLLTTTNSLGQTTTQAVVITTNASSTPTAASAASNASSSSSHTSIGAIVGGVIGALVVVGGIIVIIVMRRRARREKQYRVDAATSAAIQYDTRGMDFSDRPPSPVFDSFPVTFRTRDQDREDLRPLRSGEFVQYDDAEDDRMERLSNNPRQRESSFDPFRPGSTATGQRLGYLSIDSVGMDSLLESVTDSSSCSENDPTLTSTFGNLTRVENPYSRRPPPVTMVTAPSLHGSDISAGYKPGATSYIGGRSNSNRRSSYAGSRRDEDVEEGDEEDLGERRLSVRSSAVGSPHNRSQESFKTANEARNSVALSIESVSSDGSYLHDDLDQEHVGVRGLLLARTNT